MMDRLKIGKKLKEIHILQACQTLSMWWKAPGFWTVSNVWDNLGGGHYPKSESSYYACIYIECIVCEKSKQIVWQEQIHYHPIVSMLRASLNNKKTTRFLI
jgi:hypothetical protein